MAAPGEHEGTEQPRNTEYAGLPLTKTEFERLANVRTTLRQLVRQTELEASQLGLTPQQYQLMLAIRGTPGREWASISELAERLQIRHNAVIGLVSRAESRGLVRRVQDGQAKDRRIVQVYLTTEGTVALNVLASALRSERLRVRTALAMLETPGEAPATHSED